MKKPVLFPSSSGSYPSPYTLCSMRFAPCALLNTIYWIKSRFVVLVCATKPYAIIAILTLCSLLYALCPSISFAAVRYVSHSGSNTPPYLTWETAADSIMSAINISSFGDTIYVANGTYEEQVVMIQGLSLIGAGMDSCVIDTRALVNTYGFTSVNVANNCLLTGFQIKVYFN